MKRMILLSNGLNTGEGQKLLSNLMKELSNKKILIVDAQPNIVSKMIKESCVTMGFSESNVIFSNEVDSKNGFPDYIYVGEGNSFEILSCLQKNALIDYIIDMVEKGSIYIGASAGAAIAGSDISIIRHIEKDFVKMSSYEGLHLFEGCIIPHYTRKELNTFLQNIPSREANSYEKIYNVQDGEAIVMIDNKIIKRLRV